MIRIRHFSDLNLNFLTASLKSLRFLHAAVGHAYAIFVYWCSFFIVLLAWISTISDSNSHFSSFAPMTYDEDRCCKENKQSVKMENLILRLDYESCFYHLRRWTFLRKASTSVTNVLSCTVPFRDANPYPVTTMARFTCLSDPRTTRENQFTLTNSAQTKYRQKGRWDSHSFLV